MSFYIPALSMTKLLPFSLGAAAFSEMAGDHTFKSTKLSRLCDSFKNFPQTLTAAFIGVSFFGTASAAPAVFTAFAVVGGLSKLAISLKRITGDRPSEKQLQFDVMLDTAAKAINLAGAGYMLYNAPTNAWTLLNAGVQLLQLV